MRSNPMWTHVETCVWIRKLLMIEVNEPLEKHLSNKHYVWNNILIDLRHPVFLNA